MITLVTGGARSGKSRFAEKMFENKNDVVYIATSKIFDEEMKERINAHKESRPSSWRTYEGNYNLAKSLGEESNYLLDCITIMTSNIMFDISKDVEYINYELQQRIEDTVLSEIRQFINEIKNRNYNLTLVTNEVGYSISPDHHVSRVFRDIQGKVNQKVAELSDEVYLIACGLPVKLK